MKKRDRIHGISTKDLNALETFNALAFDPIDKALIKKTIRPRSSSGHKGTFGHVLVIAGSEGTSGAAVLTSMAALRAGCGLVTASVPQDAVGPLLANMPEVMTKTRKSPDDIRRLDLQVYDAIAFGPGVGVTTESKEMLVFLLEHYKGPMVIDADGLTLLSQEKELYDLLGDQTILTPHPVEFLRLSLTGSKRTDIIQAQIDFFKKYKSPILVKGINTTVMNQSGFFYNTTGNNGMATAGSGDVLTGIIASLCAQGYSTSDALVLGTYLHGYAGDVASSECSMHSMVATDIINGMKSFFRKFETISDQT